MVILFLSELLLFYNKWVISWNARLYQGHIGDFFQQSCFVIMIVNRNYKKEEMSWFSLVIFFGNNFYLTLIYLHLLNCFCLCFAIIFYCLFTKESIKCMIDCTLVSELVLRISWNCTGTDFGIMTCQSKAKKIQNVSYQNNLVSNKNLLLFSRNTSK